MTLLGRKVNAIASALLEEDLDGRENALHQLRELMVKKTQMDMDVEDAVRAALLDLGVPDKLTGHSKLITAVTMVVKEPELLNALVKGLYTEVALAHDTTPSRVERGIRHAIEVSWERVDMRTMQTYFGNTVSPLKDKPTNGEFIARVATVVRKRMEGGA